MEQPLAAGSFRWARRIVQLIAGLMVYGLSMALLIRSRLGNMPWDVLHQGLARQLHHSIGIATVGVAVIVLLLWIPLREKPGVGTVCNVGVIGISVDLALALIPQAGPLPARAALAGAGVLLNALATAAYIGTRLGPGPRDGLMTGLVRRTGASVRLVRTTIEVVVVAVGWALGGTLGIATVLYALSIGPLVQLSLPRFTVSSSSRTTNPPSGRRQPPPTRHRPGGCRGDAAHLHSDVEIHTQKHERPENESQHERQQIPESMNRVSVSECHHNADNQVHGATE